MAIEQFKVSENIPAPARTILGVLQAHLKITHKQAERLIHDGLVRVNNRVSSQNHKQLDVGDRVSVDYVPTPEFVAPKKQSSASAVPFTVLYDDQDIIVVNKAAGILTVPTPLSRSQNAVRTAQPVSRTSTISAAGPLRSSTGSRSLRRARVCQVC